MTTTDVTPGAAWVPQACTLPAAQQPLRVAEFDSLFMTALRSIHRMDPVRLRLVLDGAAEVETTARALARRESACCSFFTFLLTRSDEGQELYLDAVVSAAHVAVLDALADRAGALLRAEDPARRPERSHRPPVQ
ncbi:MAG TPA: hypothetical protein VHH34_05885 [Pseudonocardiaceae bacterium]|nr:hypothetical protein [Pseudonocardiaceae bacterium]